MSDDVDGDDFFDLIVVGDAIGDAVIATIPGSSPGEAAEIANVSRTRVEHQSELPEALERAARLARNFLRKKRDFQAGFSHGMFLLGQRDVEVEESEDADATRGAN